MPEKEKCANCLYRRNGHECHRYPPKFRDPTTAQLQKVENNAGMWPNTPPKEWCGEWKAKE